MNHLSQNNLNKLSNMIVEMNFIKNIAEEYICECYVMRRQKTVFYDSLTESETQLDEFVYSDFVGSLFSTEWIQWLQILYDIQE